MSCSCVYRRLACNFFKLSSTSLKIKYFSQDTSTKEVADVDLLDEFTSQLVQSKSEKWSKRRWVPKVPLSASTNKVQLEAVETVSGSSIKYLSVQEINIMFDNFICTENESGIVNLIMECIKYKKCPSFAVLNHVLSHCAQNGAKDLIIKLKNLYQVEQPSLLDESGTSFFNLYLAEAIWIKGDINKALPLFKEVYRENACLRRKTRMVLKRLITSVMFSRSEAVLLNIIDFCQHLKVEFNDNYPLLCVWQSCFLSSWFSDQNIAINLLESNIDFYKAIERRIPYMIAISLHHNRIEVVYRLLELLLKNEMKSECSGILMMLFDYYLKQHNLQSCSAIMQWCRNNDIHLPKIDNEKLLELLLKYDTTLPRSMNKETSPMCEFKF